MKYSQWVGILAALLLTAACFLPWAWYPDLKEYFTGFYSEQNLYGRPGKVFMFLSGIEILLFLIPRVWAKRSNMLIGAMNMAFAVRCYFVFAACYRGICPEKKAGIFLVPGFALIVLLATFAPDLKLKEKKEAGTAARNS